jgi:hypothetical protein
MVASAAKLYVVDVEAPGAGFHVVPPSVLTIHCTVIGVEPLAADVKLAVAPAHAAWSLG